MDEHSFFDWVSVLGPILFSWPLVIGVALILFYKPVFKFLEKVSGQDVQKAKIGPFEIEETEEAYVESLKLLLTSFVSEDELKHLKKLENEAESFPYDHASNVIPELERLHTLGFITAKNDLEQLPDEGDLKHHIELAKRGKTYLTLREKVSSRRSSEPSLSNGRAG